MTMQITDEQVRTIVAKSILDALPQETRERMLEKAIVSIITPPKKDSYNHYGSSHSSELEDLFRMCALEQVRNIVRELTEKDEAIRGRIREVVTKALSDALAGERLAGAMTDAIVGAMGGRER